MGACCSRDRIGVFVSNSHWAHALIQQAAELGAAVREDDDVTLKRLLDAGADINTLDLNGSSLLEIAYRESKPRCRVLLESRGAQKGQTSTDVGGRGLDTAAQRGEADPVARGTNDVPTHIEGRGLRNPGGKLWAVAMSLVDNVMSFHIHFRRGGDPATLTDDRAASEAESSWMRAYAGITYPRTMSLIVWRRSSTIVMSITTAIHTFFQFLGAYVAHEDWRQMRNEAYQTLNMTNVTDRFFWTADPLYAKMILSDNSTGDCDSEFSCTDVGLLRLEEAGHRLRCHELGVCPVGANVLEGLASGMSSFDSCDQTSSMRVRNCSYFDAPRLETFPEYSLRIAEVGLQRMILDAEEKKVIIYYAVATCAFLAWLCNLAAMASWYNLRKSKNWIAIGWLFTFIAPFVISVVPMRMFVSWEAFDPVRDAYFQSFQDYYKLKQKEQLIRRICEPIVNGSYETQVMKGYDNMEEQMLNLIGYYDGTPCLDDETLTGGNPGLFCDCDMSPQNCWGTSSCPFFDPDGSPTYPNTRFHRPPPAVRAAGGYFKHLESLHAVEYGGVRIEHMIDFRCSNLVDSELPLATKKLMCEQPVNRNVQALEAACRTAALTAGLTLGGSNGNESLAADPPFVGDYDYGGCFTHIDGPRAGMAFFSRRRPQFAESLGEEPTVGANGEVPLGRSGIGDRLTMVSDILAQRKFSLPRPAGAVGSFMSVIGSAYDWNELVRLAEESDATRNILEALQSSPPCEAAQCTESDFQVDTTGQLPSWMATTPLVEVCPTSCGGCGQMGKMIGISIRALEMIDATTASAMQESREVNAEAMNAARGTADASFEATSATVDASFSQIEAGAENVAGGIDSACDTLDDWAPLINTANDIGDFFSSFRRLKTVEAKLDETMFSRSTKYLFGSAPGLLSQLRESWRPVEQVAERFPIHQEAELWELWSTQEDTHGLSRRSRRRLGAQDDCRNTQARANRLVDDVGSSRDSSLGAIADSQRDVADAMNNAEMRVDAGINAAEQRIRDSIRAGRNQMIEAFETTRTLCNTIRNEMNTVRNSTESVFDYMATGCEVVVSVMADPPGNADGAYAAVQDMMTKLRQPIELTIGIMHALMGFKMMIPAAIAIAPGLMKGALAVKMLVPQSSLPGVFVVLLPWLYCPIMWCLYNFVFQLIGNPIMLFALLLLAYAPMVNVVVGEWKQISQPMNDSEILTVTKIIERYGLMANTVAALCFVAFLVTIRNSEELDGVDTRGVATNLLDQMMKFRVLLEMLASSISKKFYTTLAGVDYMISTIVEDRRFEVMLVELKRPPKPRGCCGRKQRHSIHDVPAKEDVPADNETDEETVSDTQSEGKSCCGFGTKKLTASQKILSEQAQLREMFDNRRVRLDDLVKLMYVSEDKDFAKKKNMGIAAARVQNSAAKKALLQVANEKTPVGYLVVAGMQCKGLLTADMVTHESDTEKASDEKHPPPQPDPYVQLELEQLDPATGEPMVDIYRTNVASKTTCPVWEEVFRIPVWDIRASLYMHVYDKQLTRDTFIGESMITTPELLKMITTAGSRRENERLPLKRCSQPSKSQTERFTKECFGGLLCVTTWFEFPNLREGCCAVTLKGARGLKAADHVIGGEDTSDPFAVVSVHQMRDSRLHVQKHKTDKVECTLNPDWIDPSTGRAPVIYCDIWDRASATLYIDVYDADLTSDDYLGQARLNLNEYCAGSDSKDVELKITPFIPVNGRALAQKHMEVMDVSGSIQLSLQFDVERARLEHSDGGKLDASLEAAMARRGLIESRKVELRQASAEAKLQFIKFAAAPPVLRQPPALRGVTRQDDSPALASAQKLRHAVPTADRGSISQQGPEEQPFLLRQRAPTTSPRPLPQREVSSSAHSVRSLPVRPPPVLGQPMSERTLPMRPNTKP